MTNTEVNNPVTPTTNEQQNPHLVHEQKEPDWMDRFAAWARPKVNRFGSFIWNNKEFFAQAILADMDSRRTQRNVRRVIEQRQEIEMQTPSLYLKTTVPQTQRPVAPMKVTERPAIKQQRLPGADDGEKRKDA